MKFRLMVIAHPDDDDPLAGHGMAWKEVDLPFDHVPCVGELMKLPEDAHLQFGQALSKVSAVIWWPDGIPILVFTSWLNEMARGIWEARGFQYTEQIHVLLSKHLLPFTPTRTESLRGRLARRLRRRRRIEPFPNLLGPTQREDGVWDFVGPRWPYREEERG